MILEKTKKDNLNINLKNEMELKFKSKSENEAFSRIAVAAFVSQLNPTVEELSDIKTAVSEAVTNSIVHGYKELDGDIKIKCVIDGNNVLIEIIDYGQGIENIKEARKPLYTSKHGDERAGMGFTIMENFMDKLVVESIVGIGTKIIMEKEIKIESKESNT